MEKKAYNEVLEILKYIPVKHYLKIPREKISELMLEKDEEYEFHYDNSKKVSEQNISKEALEIFTKLYYEYIADDIEKKGIAEMLDINEKLSEIEERN